MTEAATKSITIQGLAVEVAAPYSEGHTVTEAEARALNQVRAEAIRNNCARMVKAELKEAEVEDVEALDEDTVANLFEKIAEYDAGYEFTIATVGGGSRKKDPVEVEAIKIARAALNSMLQAKGHKVKDIMANKRDWYDTKLADLASREGTIAQARANVAAIQAASEETLEDLDI